MPCYNAAAFLTEAVESVMRQSYPMIELIIIDDGSTDESLALARSLMSRYMGKVTVLRQPNLGPYPARNNGLQHASGEFIAFLDADDYWEDDCLQVLHQAMEKEQTALAYCGWQNIGATLRSNEPFIPRNYEAPNKVELLLAGGAPWPIHAALVRRAVIDQVGGFSTDLKTSLDYELWLRLASSSRVTLVEKVLAYYRFHDKGQISAHPWRQAINAWRIKKRFLKDRFSKIEGRDKERMIRAADMTLMRHGLEAYWRCDYESAWHVFRQCSMTRSWKLSDSRYLAPALALPESAYKKIMSWLYRT